jgi:FkbM family methyltransferase
MRLFIEKTIRRIYTGAFPYSRLSYSQNGEDIILKDLFHRLKITHPTYLDIGANEAFSISNTYLLYSKGSKGVCIEPNIHLYQEFKKKRPRDISLHAGVAFDQQTEADFYLFPKEANGLGTFSKEEAGFWETTGNSQVGKFKVEKVIKVALVNINEVMEKYFSPHPNLVSIDVEGLDLAILRMIDMHRFRPEVFCVETIGYTANDKETKNEELIGYLLDQGYFIYADTYINTIFCRKDAYPFKEF